ncbi:MAG: hypothetical protein GF408_06595 [Candidatus Omnitrophica bacterium]|nr:hypothetical protein [Candidatus Omnitrophota bacterium]
MNCNPRNDLGRGSSKNKYCVNIMIETRCIATAGDANYYPGVAALLRSLKRTNPEIPLIVFDGGFTVRQRNRIKRFAGVVRKEPFAGITGRGKFSYIGDTTLLKFEVAELEFDKVLFLDCDTVVLDRLENAFEIPPGRVGAVRERTALKNIFRLKDRPVLMKVLGLEWEETVINGGMFVLRPSEWKDLKGKAEDLISAFGADTFSKTKDHQLLNIIFSGKIHDLPGKYNFSPVYDEDGITEPAVIHYLEEKKPWHAGYPEKLRYREYRENVSVGDCPAILVVDGCRKIRRVSRILSRAAEGLFRKCE